MAQTSWWLPGPKRVLDGGTQVALGTLETLPPRSVPGSLPFPHYEEEVRATVQKGQWAG